MLVEINKVIVNDRIRKDFGDIDGLANSIKTKGLINPPVVTPEFELIAGERRYKALKQLGYNQIEVRVMSVEDEEHMLNLEIDENEERKEFSKLERLDWARRLERIESIKAEKRKLATLSQNVSDVENFPPRDAQGKTRDIVAEKLGIGSGRQYEKEKYIEDNLHLATEEEKQAWDRGDISDHAMFKKIKAEKDVLEGKTKELENKMAELEGEKMRLSKQLEEANNKKDTIKEIEVEKIVDNTDYSLVEKANRLEQQVLSKDKEYRRLHGDYSQKVREIQEMKQQLEAMKQSKEEKKYVEELEQNSLLFCAKVEKFIKEVGGLAYLSNHLNELSKPNQQAYLKCVELINAWGQNVLANTHNYL